jgi:hypothetical protein
MTVQHPFAMSTDGGLTWSQPIQINQTPTDIPAGDQQAFRPSIAVARNGTVAVTYYDFRFNDPSPGLATDYWFVRGDPHGRGGLTNPANWGDELRLTDSSFDLEKAPDVSGPFVGDYQGLAAVGNGFLALFAQPHGTDPDSIFSRQIKPGNAGHQRGDGHDDERPNGHHNEHRLGGVLLASSMPIVGLTDSSAPAASTAKAGRAPVDVQRLPLDEVRRDRFFAAGREEDGRLGIVRAQQNPLSWADDPWAAVAGSDDTLGDGLFPALWKE